MRRVLADEFDEDLDEDEEDDALGVCARVAKDVRRHERALLDTLKPELERRKAKVTEGIVRDGRGLLAKRDPRKAFFESGRAVSTRVGPLGRASGSDDAGSSLKGGGRGAGGPALRAGGP